MMIIVVMCCFCYFVVGDDNDDDVDDDSDDDDDEDDDHDDELHKDVMMMMMMMMMTMLKMMSLMVVTMRNVRVFGSSFGVVRNQHLPRLVMKLELAPRGTVQVLIYIHAFKLVHTSPKLSPDGSSAGFHVCGEFGNGSRNFEKEYKQTFSEWKTV
ncbi:hypothetical protein PoB_002784700 [Plakobranchus ocellatus]|uniref:Uncharacterized protein n=1 Tax=Plakobranchus ocellatus TaxID=259542 RepID=A0AAV4A220_9GAST|nr:hypothetical protein PoB_002784700 [Plakobranchus ocellatus]